VGSATTRLEPIVAGGALEVAAAAQAAAAPGEVVVHTALLPDLGWARAEPRDGAPGAATLFAVTRTVDIPDPAPLAPLPQLSQAAVQRILAFLPPTIAERLDSGYAGFVGEHRAVTALFLSFSGFDYDQDPEVGLRLQRYLARVFAVVQRYDGYVNKVTMGDKGSTALVLFGAPLAHEDDAARALQCALELRDVRSERAEGFSLQMGVASGFVFSGQVGSSARQEYTVIGDAVNLAARLMQSAGPCEILVEEPTSQAARGGFCWGEPRRLRVRGRSAEVAALPLDGLGASSALPGPHSDAMGLVGRDAELAALRERLGLALEGRGQVVALRGAAGVGKSAMVAAALAEAARYGVRRLSGEGVSYRSASPYLVWRPILRGLLGLDAAGADGQAASVAAHVRALDPRLLPRLPLLNALAGLQLAESDLTAAMDSEARKLATEALAGDLIAAATAEGPLAIVLESCQWIDPLSRDLLLSVARRSAGLPVLLIFAYRGAPEAREEWAAPLRSLQLPHLAELQLDDLAAEDAALLTQRLLARRFGPGAAIADALMAQILGRAQGNPLFITELVGLVHERGVDPARAGEELELPDSLHRLVLSRIDRLGEGARTVLKVASVVGQEFSPRWLAGVYPPVGSGEQLDRTLDELRRAELAVLDHGGAEPAYLFRHVITREVAYESLSTVLRASLHARVGDFIEATYSADLEPFLDLLAHHYSLSDNREKRREYLLRAGVAAQAAFANEAAVSFYERLLPLIPERERSDVLLRLGQVLRHVGRWEEAEAVFRDALRLANDQVTAARCRLEQGDLLRERGDPAAVEWLEAARRSFAAAGHGAGLGEAEQRLGLVAMARGDYQQALAAFESALKPIAESGDKGRSAKLLVNLGAVFWSSGDLPRALDCFERSLRLAGEAGNRHYVGVAVGNLGGIYHLRGDYGRALDCYVQTLQCAFDVGDRLEMCISIGNLGHIYEDQGEYRRAKSCYLRSLEIALDLGDRMGVGTALQGLSTLAAAEVDLVEATMLADQAEAVFAAMGAGYELADSRLLRADLAARSGVHELAQLLLREAGALADEAGNAEAAFRCAALSVEVEHARGAISSQAAVAALRAMLDAQTGEEQRADLLAAIVRVDGAQAAARAAAAGLYRSLHMATPKASYRRAYAALMGVALPAPAPLPALPAAVTRRLPSYGALLERAEGFAATLQGDLLARAAAD
jgi:adenylate cyclase